MGLGFGRHLCFEKILSHRSGGSTTWESAEINLNGSDISRASFRRTSSLNIASTLRAFKPIVRNRYDLSEPTTTGCSARRRRHECADRSPGSGHHPPPMRVLHLPTVAAHCGQLAEQAVREARIWGIWKPCCKPNWRTASNGRMRMTQAGALWKAPVTAGLNTFSRTAVQARGWFSRPRAAAHQNR